MQIFLSGANSCTDLVKLITKKVSGEIARAFDYPIDENDQLVFILSELHAMSDEAFVFVIDEWDCVFRSTTKEDYEKYLDFLRTLLKDQPYVELAYMTGILPIKKYGTHSALNMFDEISMILPTPYEKFMGFTEEEVEELCKENDMDFNEMQSWYNGYHFKNNVSIYSPRSVVLALNKKEYSNYWTSSETYEALANYINMNYDGLKETIIKLLSGEKVKVDTSSFVNDMTTFNSKDDILTLLIHLGYLGYESPTNKVYIPNKEVSDAFVTSIKNNDWKEATTALINSENTIEALWNKDGKKVAQYIEQAHLETSILQYNDENALAYTVYLALISARNYYSIVRELPSGKGFADIAFITFTDKPAMIVELKWDKDANSAIKQIKNKQYPKSLEKYQDNLIMVGINYDKVTKKHTCIIE